MLICLSVCLCPPPVCLCTHTHLAEKLILATKRETDRQTDRQAYPAVMYSLSCVAHIFWYVSQQMDNLDTETHSVSV